MSGLLRTVRMLLTDPAMKSSDEGLKRPMTQLTLMGIKITNCSKEELTDYVCQVIRRKGKELIPNVNINCMNLCWKKKWLRDLINSSEVVFCDGDGVRLGGDMVGRHIKEKITYNRWIWNLAETSVANGFTWYLLGSRPDAVERAVKTLQERYPGLGIVGFHSGYISNSGENDAIVAEINRTRPNILIVGMGMPRQEQWLQAHMPHLNINVALTGGAVCDYVAGEINMTPDVFYRLKLEWLYRLLQEPRRLFGRYIIGNPLFLWRVIIYHWLNVRPR